MMMQMILCTLLLNQVVFTGTFGVASLNLDEKTDKVSLVKRMEMNPNPSLQHAEPCICTVCGADPAPNNPFRRVSRPGQVFTNRITHELCEFCTMTGDALLDELEYVVDSRALQRHMEEEEKKELERKAIEEEARRRRQRDSGFTGIGYFDDPEGLNMEAQGDPPPAQLMTRQDSLRSGNARRRPHRGESASHSRD